MSRQDRIDEAIASLHEAMLGDGRWAATSARIDEACGWQGSHLVIFDGHSRRSRPDWLFDQFYYHGESAAELGRTYVEDFFRQDERIPRIMRLPDRRLTRVADLLTARELKTSATYNDLLRWCRGQNGFNVRMDGPDGLDVAMGIADPTAADGWSSGDIETIEHLLPHIRQFVRVRHALVRAEALGTALSGLLSNTMVGVIYVDRRGMIVEANARACEILRRGDGLSDRDGVLRARLATDDAKLGKLLADALPGGGRQPVSGSMTVERSHLLPRLVVHVNPVTVHQLDFGAMSAAALVLIVDPGSRLGIDPDLVAATFRLTRAESQVAAALAEGNTVGEFAAATRRAESTVRWLVKQVHTKLGVSRQAELVRMVLTAAGSPKPHP